MHIVSNLALVLGPLALLARADADLDWDDVPQDCRAVCQPTHDLTEMCDPRVDASDRIEDQLEWQCVCTNDSFDVEAWTSQCADCMEQFYAANPDYDGDDDDDNDDDDDDDVDPDNARDALQDIREIMARCSFTSTSYDASASVTTSISVDATPATATSDLTTTYGTETNIPSPTSGGGSGNNDDSNDDNSNNDNNDSNDNNNDGTDNSNSGGDGDSGAGAALVSGKGSVAMCLTALMAGGMYMLF
jgi:Tfp pilus assembly protein PilE